ncbi:MAG: hypothetical protein ABJC80_09635 [Tateyamaria sp.]|uniref:hypothetical protein n=1 Tax=Tateyamaria sp. TaxID=1929288 RepID=UPI0032739DC5
MKRLLSAILGFCMCFVAGMVSAQDPQIEIVAEQEEVIVGQPYILRVKVLVPTFMPKPPVFPTFEVPGLIVRLPERSTSPVSERIEGETWAGVQRTYRIYPMQAGVTEIPEQQLSIVYKDTQTNEDVPLSVPVPATTITAIVPEGASDLDPLILANGLSIEQTWQGGEEELAVGDAVVRSLDITISGTSALFIPPLLESASSEEPPASSAEGAETETETESAATFAPYPEDAVVTEIMERGVMSGARTETVSYIAQSGGTAVFPDITLQWYNLVSEEIEEITLPGLTVTVAQPPKERTPIDPRAAIKWVLVFVLAVVVAWVAYRFVYPIARPRLQRLQERYAASPIAAHRLAEKKAAAKDLNGLFFALEQRSVRGVAPGEDLETAITALGRTLYRESGSNGSSSHQWQIIQRSLRKERRALIFRHHAGTATKLPPLNPFV